MTQPFRFREFICPAPDRSELHTLSSLIIQERNLTIVGSPCPLACHKIRNGSHIRIVNCARGGSWNSFSLFSSASEISEHAITAAYRVRRLLVQHECRTSETRNDICLRQHIGPNFI